MDRDDVGMRETRHDLAFSLEALGGLLLEKDLDRDGASERLVLGAGDDAVRPRPSSERRRCGPKSRGSFSDARDYTGFMGSPWLDGSGGRRPALEGDARCSIAVVGGGIAGVSAACFLARRGCDVVLLEKDVLGGGATGRSLGLLRDGIHLPYDVARENHGPETARSLWKLTRENRNLIAALGVDCGFAVRGSLRTGECAAAVEALRRDGFPAELRPDGAFFPDDAEFDPVRFVRGLAREAERAGARIYEGTPALSLGAAVKTPRGRVEAAMTLLATDAWSPGLHGLFEEVIAPVRGQCLMTEPAPRILSCPVVSGMDVLRQLDDGRILAFGGRQVAPNQEYTLSDRTTQPIQDYLDRLVAGRLGGPPRVARRWAGPMAFTCDELPCVGPLPGAVSQYACVGWQSSGLSLAVVCARMAAEMMLDGRSSPECALFSLRRHL